MKNISVKTVKSLLDRLIDAENETSRIDKLINAAWESIPAELEAAWDRAYDAEYAAYIALAQAISDCHPAISFDQAKAIAKAKRDGLVNLLQRWEGGAI